MPLQTHRMLRLTVCPLLSSTSPVLAVGLALLALGIGGVSTSNCAVQGGMCWKGHSQAFGMLDHGALQGRIEAGDRWAPGWVFTTSLLVTFPGRRGKRAPG